MDYSKYLTVSEVAEKTGFKTRTLERRLKEGIVPLYADPRWKSRRLIRIDDVAKLMEIKPR